jgi:hypothetical protein
MASLEARVIRPNRSQLRWDMMDLESLLSSDHRARMVWAFVEQMDLNTLYAAVGSREPVSSASSWHWHAASGSWTRASCAQEQCPTLPRFVPANLLGLNTFAGVTVWDGSGITRSRSLPAH